MPVRKNHLLRAVGLMWKTRPFLRTRLAVYGVFFFAAIGYTATAVRVMAASTSALTQFIVLVVAVGLYVLAQYYLKRYLTYAGRTPHLMAMVTAIKGGKLPKGHAQIEEATRLADVRFPDAGRLVQLERLLRRILRETRAVVLPDAPSAPGKPPSKLRKVGKLVGAFSLRRMADAIYGYAFYVEKPNVWKSARRGVALYAQSARRLTRSAFRVQVVGLFVFLVFAGLVLWPGWSIVQWSWNEQPITFIGVMGGLVMAGWVVKAALFDPVALAWLLSVFIREADGIRDVDRDWIGRLEESSKRFRELGERANAFSSPPESKPEAEVAKPPPEAQPSVQVGDIPAEDEPKPPEAPSDGA